MRVNEENGRAMVMGKGRIRKVWQFSRNKFLRTICCHISNPTFGIGGSRLWEKEEEKHISRKKRKRHLFTVKVYLYEVCVYSILFMIFIIVL